MAVALSHRGMMELLYVGKFLGSMNAMGLRSLRKGYYWVSAKLILADFLLYLAWRLATKPDV